MSCISRQNYTKGSVLRSPYLNLGIDGPLLIVELVIIVGVHFQVVESKLLLNPLLKRLALFEGQRVSLGNHGDNVDNVGQLLQNNDIDRFEAV